MCVLEIRDRALKFDSLIGENIYSTHIHTERDVSQPPTPKIAFEGAVGGNPKAVCHQQIQDEGVEASREVEEEDVRVRIYSTLW